MNKYLKIILLAVGTLYGCTNNSKKPVVYSGVYNGKNLLLSSENGCIEKIVVNGNEVAFRDDTNVIEIDFKKLKIKIGDIVSVKIIHSEGCFYFYPINKDFLIKTSD